MDTDYCVVMTTFSEPEIGKKIIESLLHKRLVACVQVTPIQSYYHWQGKIANDQEQQVMIKTKTSLFTQVYDEIIAYHDYETPEVIQIPITNGSAEYLAWIDKECT